MRYCLSEGWDNPNVFQICTLKTQGESEIRSRQEIGRGLRLCVNQNGERMNESVLGSEVQELNKLTLITDMTFGKFATALQEGLAESMFAHPRTVDAGVFAGQILTDANGAQVKITPTLATSIYEDLVQQGYVHRGALTDKYYAAKDAGTVQVAEEVQGCEGAVMQVLSSIYDPRARRTPTTTMCKPKWTSRSCTTANLPSCGSASTAKSFTRFPLTRWN